MRTKALVATSLVLIAGSLAACGKKAGEAGDGQTAATEPSAASAVANASATPPKRKPGLWQQTMTLEGAGRGSMVSKICTDEAFEQKASVFANNAMPGACSESGITPTGGGWKFHSVCNMGSGGTTVSDGVVTGDMASRYEIKTTTSTTGAAAPQMNRSAQMTIAAERLGDCPAGWAGGDMELPGGVRIQGSSMMKGAAAGPAK